MREKEEELKEGPQDGCYITGLFVEGARWDHTHHQLTESRPKELYTDLPVLWLKPEANRKMPESGIYDCPCYKTLTRAGWFLFAVVLFFKEKKTQVRVLSLFICCRSNLLLAKTSC